MQDQHFFANPNCIRDLEHLAYQAPPPVVTALSQLPHTDRALRRAQQSWSQTLERTRQRNVEQAEQMRGLLADCFAVDAQLSRSLKGME